MTTWREYVLMIRAHDQERIERFEEVRMIAFCSVMPYLKDQNMTIDRFWPLPSDKNNDEEKIDNAQKLMDEITAKYREFYKR